MQQVRGLPTSVELVNVAVNDLLEPGGRERESTVASVRERLIRAGRGGGKLVDVCVRNDVPNVRMVWREGQCG